MVLILIVITNIVSDFEMSGTMQPINIGTVLVIWLIIANTITNFDILNHDQNLTIFKIKKIILAIYISTEEPLRTYEPMHARTHARTL